MSSKAKTQAKITILQPTELKRKVARAAAKRGMTVTSYINYILSLASEKTLERVRRRTISERDQRQLLAFLKNPEGPNPALLKAATRYRERYSG